MTILLALAAAMAPTPTAEPIAMTRKSWGKTLSDWRIEPDGSIRYDYSTPSKEPSTEPEDFNRYTLVTKRTAPSPARYRWIATVMQPVRAALAKPLPCDIRITDMPYGEVTWGEAPSAASMTYNTGCREARTRALVDRLMRAQRQIEKWTKAAPIAATQEVRPHAR